MENVNFASCSIYTATYGVSELISSVSFDSYQRKLFLSGCSKLFDGLTLQSKGVASDSKLQSAEQVAVSLRVEHISFFSLPLCVLDLSLSLFLSFSQHPAWQIAKGFFFYSLHGSIISERHTANQTYLLQQRLSHRFSLHSRFLVQLLPAQMSPLVMFLSHTLLPSPPASSVSAAFLVPFWRMSQGWGTKLKHLLRPVSGQIRLWSVQAALHGPDQYIMLIFPTGQVSLGVHCGLPQASILER